VTAALDEFRALLAQEDAKIDLARGCLMIAQDEYPGLDVERYLAELDRMGERLRAEHADATAVEDKIIALNQFLFEELDYAGNADDYYDPGNSYLNEVMDRRTGIPITLSIIYMEAGRRMGLPVEGVSFPGHFLVRVRMRRGMLVLDPFAGGVPLSEDDLRARLKRVVPRAATGKLAPEDLPLDTFLEPASNRQVLARVLRNLKGIWREKDEPQKLLAVLDRTLVVAPDSHDDLRDRGLLYERLECWRPALQDLRDYLAREPDAADMDDVRARVVDLSARCARLN
jgi:regulator of sirC expression with transglutaminase-like and TPR domain